MWVPAGIVHSVKCWATSACAPSMSADAIEEASPLRGCGVVAVSDLMRSLIIRQFETCPVRLRAEDSAAEPSAAQNSASSNWPLGLTFPSDPRIAAALCRRFLTGTFATLTIDDWAELLG